MSTQSLKSTLEPTTTPVPDMGHGRSLVADNGDVFCQIYEASSIAKHLFDVKAKAFGINAVIFQPPVPSWIHEQHNSWPKPQSEWRQQFKSELDDLAKRVYPVWRLLIDVQGGFDFVFIPISGPHSSSDPSPHRTNVVIGTAHFVPCYANGLIKAGEWLVLYMAGGYSRSDAVCVVEELVVRNNENVSNHISILAPIEKGKALW